MRQLFYYKMQQKFITKCVSFLLQNAAVITKCYVYYKLWQYNEHILSMLEEKKFFKFFKFFVSKRNMKPICSWPKKKIQKELMTPLNNFSFLFNVCICTNKNRLKVIFRVVFTVIFKEIAKILFTIIIKWKYSYEMIQEIFTLVLKLISNSTV